MTELYKNNKKVFVGVSGGVDSAVSAFFLKKQGYDVTGIYMKNWKKSFEPMNSEIFCQNDSDMEDARNICMILDIPFYVFDFSDEYKAQVFDECINVIESGKTPNPDVWCNQKIKFNLFVKRAIDLGADYIATGHYARIIETSLGRCLAKAIDLSKDQSYFLYSIDKDVLNKIIFPIGHLKKKDVRSIAKENGIFVFDKKDSVGICFIGKRKFSDFISQFIPYKIGDITDQKNNIIGKHKGLHLYTIGQRKGIDLKDFQGPYYVIDKDVASNKLIVSNDISLLMKKQCCLDNLHFLVDEKDVNFQNIFCKIRYRSNDIKCSLNIKDKIVDFDMPVKSITPGQSIVFYFNEICLGGGIIVN